MKKILKAFTLIELIVVTTIIAIMSWSWVFYFFDFAKDQEISQNILVLEEEFNDLDKDVENYITFDYELILNTSVSSWAYITYINNFDIPYNQTIDFNSNTWNWIIYTNWTWSWVLKIYKNIKLFLNEEINRWSGYNFDFNETSKYKILGNLSLESLNEININYFVKDNLYPENNNLLNLISINTKEDKTWNTYSSLIVKNVWWNKKILWNWITLENEIYLFFENNWLEKFIKIK